MTENALDLGTEQLVAGGVHAADIANTKDVSAPGTPTWMASDMSKPVAEEYYDSVLALLASWEIDFLKVDDLSAPRYHAAEVESASQGNRQRAGQSCFRHRPARTPVNEGTHVMYSADQWRISDDFWDHWRLLKEQFARLDAWTPYRGPGHFPDADMLPVGNIRAFQPNDAWTHSRTTSRRPC